MRKDDSNKFSGWNREDFEKLPPTACAALAFRAAVRVLPVLGGTDDGLAFWPEEDWDSHLGVVFAAIDCSSLIALKRRDLVPGVGRDIYARALRVARVARNSRAAEAIAVAAYAAFATAKGGAYSAYSVSISVVPDVEGVAQGDLFWLLERSDEWRSSLVSSFLSRPLWASPTGTTPPESWAETYERWQKLMLELGHSELVERYQGWLEGRIEPAEVVARRLDEWYERYGAVAEGAESVEDDLIPGVERKGAFGGAAVKGASAPEPEVAMAPPAESAEEAEVVAAEALAAGVVTAQADRPAKIDNLGRQSLVNTLADMLASPDQSLPMTIALLGDWGAGKSSLIEQVKVRLDEVANSWQTVGQRDARIRYLHAEFNAWEYEQTDNIRAGLAQEVVNGLTAGLSWGEKITFALTNAWQQHRWAFIGSLSGFLVVIAAMLAASLSDITLKEGMAGSFVGVGAGAFFSFILYQAWKTARTILEHPLANRLYTYLKLPSYGQHLGLVPVIREQIGALCRYRLGKLHNGRLLVVVDDLDRCSPECITQTLDAVRLVMSLERVAVIIAIDDRVAFQAVAKHYEKLGDKVRPGSAIARDYLGKIIQLPINLPQPGTSDLQGFIRHSLFRGVQSAPPPSPPLVEATDGGKPVPPDLPVTAAVEVGDDVPPLAVSSQEPDDPRAGVVAEGARMRGEDRTEEVGESFEQFQKEMADSAGERLWFEELAGVLGFSNPRQLIRLKNSYRFLKGAYHRKGKVGGDGRSACRAMMCALFWSEYLYQLPQLVADEPNRERHHLEVALWDLLSSGEQGGAETLTGAMAAQFRAVLKEMDRPVSGYFELMQRVAMVVMPSAQGGVFLTKEALARYVEGQEEGAAQ